MFRILEWKLNIIASCKIASTQQSSFPMELSVGSLRNGNDSHPRLCLSEWSVVSAIVVRQSNQTQNEYHAMVVVDFKSRGFLVFFLLSPCFPVLKSAEKATKIAFDLT